MGKYDYDDIIKVIDERTRDWSLDKSEKDSLNKKLIDIMNYCEKEGIIFDDTAGPVFVTHLITLYGRVKQNQFVDLEINLTDEISVESLRLAEKISSYIESQYGSKIPKTETALIATHLGAMQLRLNEEKGEV